jgi:hypothetical protein
MVGCTLTTSRRELSGFLLYLLRGATLLAVGLRIAAQVRLYLHTGLVIST